MTANTSTAPPNAVEHLAFARIDHLFDALFRPGHPARSAEFKRGARTALERAAGFYLRRNPHPAGTAAADAWSAGFDAGKRAWALDADRGAV